MNKTIVLLIASDGYQQVEYGVTKDVLLQSKQVNVLTASDKPGTATAKDGSTTTVDLTIDQIDPHAIDGLFLIGGPGALTCLDTQKVHKLLQELMALNKPYGAICISSRILAKAGVLGNKKATGWDGDEKLNGIFDEHGVTYVRKPEVTDGHIVTATGPSAAESFGKSIVQVLQSRS
jgi:putative intracellular protease/amidase